MYDWSSLGNYSPQFSFFWLLLDLSYFPFKSDYFSHFVLYCPGSLIWIIYSVKLFMLNIFSHYIFYFLFSLDHNTLFVFIISLGLIFQLLPKNSNMIEYAHHHSKSLLVVRKFIIQAKILKLEVESCPLDNGQKLAAY